MDFNLDGDFDKLSSFKVDMSDLDFSCSPKKTVKPKERSGEERSSGNHKGKKDGFNFSFDFSKWTILPRRLWSFLFRSIVFLNFIPAIQVN